MDAFFAIVLLFSALMLFRINKVVDAVIIIAVQSAILAVIGTMIWLETGIWHVLLAASLTFLIKALLIPAILFRVSRGEMAKRKIKRVFSSHISVFIAIVLIIVGYHVAAYLPLPENHHGQAYLATSISLLLLGTFSMIDHNHPIMQGIGLIVIENAIFLIPLAISYGMPLFIELGIMLDMLVAAAVIATLTLKIYNVFHSTNISRMQNLKG